MLLREVLYAYKVLSISIWQAVYKNGQDFLPYSNNYFIDEFEWLEKMCSLLDTLSSKQLLRIYKQHETFIS